MIDPREERELEAYLAGESPVSKRYAQGPAAMPPPELDAAILAAAETELKVVPLQRKWRRWGTAVGVAASILLAVTLVLQMTIQPGSVPEVSAPELLDELRVESAPAPEQKAARNALQQDQAFLPKSPADTRARTTEELRSSAVQKTEQAGRAVVAKESARRADTRDANLAGLVEPPPDVSAGNEEELVLPDATESGQVARKASPTLRPAVPAARLAAPALPTVPEESSLTRGRVEDIVTATRRVDTGLTEVPLQVSALPEADSDAPGDPDRVVATGAGAPAVTARTPENVLLAAIPMIEDFQAEQARQASSGMEEIIVTSRRVLSPDEIRQEREAARAQEAAERESEAAAAELEAILRLNADDRPAQAYERLAAFRDRYPAHPVSVSLRDEGY